MRPGSEPDTRPLLQQQERREQQQPSHQQQQQQQQLPQQQHQKQGHPRQQQGYEVAWVVGLTLLEVFPAHFRLASICCCCLCCCLCYCHCPHVLLPSCFHVASPAAISVIFPFIINGTQLLLQDSLLYIQLLLLLLLFVLQHRRLRGFAYVAVRPSGVSVAVGSGGLQLISLYPFLFYCLSGYCCTSQTTEEPPPAARLLQRSSYACGRCNPQR